MIDLNELFQSKKLNINKAIDFGFTDNEEELVFSKKLLNHAFVLTIHININNQQLDYFLIDSLTNEDYPMIKVESAQGVFVTELRHECLTILSEIAEKCYEISPFKYEQSLRVIDFISDNFYIAPEFPWKKYAGNAVFRHDNNQKWFAAILSVDYSKIDPSKKGPIEVINLKELPEKVTALIDNTSYYLAYHMNKKHWYSIVLDGSLNDDELFEKIIASFGLTRKS